LAHIAGRARGAGDERVGIGEAERRAAGTARAATVRARVSTRSKPARRRAAAGPQASALGAAMEAAAGIAQHHGHRLHARGLVVLDVDAVIADVGAVKRTICPA
jgi:hypothetical protein